MTWTRSTTNDGSADLMAAADAARSDVEAARAAVARGDEGASAVSAAEYRHHCALLAVDRAREDGRAARLADAVSALAAPQYRDPVEPAAPALHHPSTDTEETTA